MKAIQMLQAEGVTVEVSMLDCVDRAEAVKLLDDCQRLAPLGGIFHLAMVLEDRLLLNHVRGPPDTSTHNWSFGLKMLLVCVACWPSDLKC